MTRDLRMMPYCFVVPKCILSCQIDLECDSEVRRDDRETFRHLRCAGFAVEVELDVQPFAEYVVGGEFQGHGAQTAAQLRECLVDDADVCVRVLEREVSSYIQVVFDLLLLFA